MGGEAGRRGGHPPPPLAHREGRGADDGGATSVQLGCVMPRAGPRPSLAAAWGRAGVTCGQAVLARGRGGRRAGGEGAGRRVSRSLLPHRRPRGAAGRFVRAAGRLGLGAAAPAGPWGCALVGGPRWRWGRGHGGHKCNIFELALINIMINLSYVCLLRILLFYYLIFTSSYFWYTTSGNISIRTYTGTYSSNGRDWGEVAHTNPPAQGRVWTCVSSLPILISPPPPPPIPWIPSLTHTILFTLLAPTLEA